ncbi:MAG: CPBP family intramembrane metalloprotease [Candidatus Brocadiae bacterium]|nr:CPBP family intramembrane metalloprotease [Candidatus Brocadiia bacterium]
MSDSVQKSTRGEKPGYYWESRSFAIGIVSILPLVVLYHFGIVQSGYSVRNIAEVWLTGPLDLIGLHAAHVLNVMLVVALVALLWHSGERESFSFLTIAVMIAESAVYAALLCKGAPALAGLVSERASQVFFSIQWQRSAPLLLALGAGVYEELFFRLLILGGGALAMQRVFMWNKKWSVGAMLVISSVLFAAAHHVGPLGQDFQAYDFLFRAICGVLLGVLFLTRGVGVTVWTHAIYNALVILQRAG